MLHMLQQDRRKYRRLLAKPTRNASERTGPALPRFTFRKRLKVKILTMYVPELILTQDSGNEELKTNWIILTSKSLVLFCYVLDGSGYRFQISKEECYTTTLENEIYRIKTPSLLTFQIKSIPPWNRSEYEKCNRRNIYLTLRSSKLYSS